MKFEELITRRMILSIPCEEVLRSIQKLGNTHIIKHRKELPIGYIILDVHYNYERRCFDFLIVHESFGIIKGGMRVPRCDDLVLMDKMYKVEPYELGVKI